MWVGEGGAYRLGIGGEQINKCVLGGCLGEGQMNKCGGEISVCVGGGGGGG